MNNYKVGPQDPKIFFKTIAVIHMALIAGQVLFATVAFSLTRNMVFNAKPANDIFFFIAPSLALIGMIGGTLLYNRRLKNLADKTSLKEKLTAYQAAFISRCALAEAPSMFAIVVCLVTGNLFYLAISGIIVLYFLWIKPTKDKVEDDLSLSYEDKIEFGS